MHTIAGEDRVGIVNGEYTFLNNAALVAGGNSTIGVSELEVQSLSVGGRLIVSGGSFTLSVMGTSVAVGTDNLVSVFNAKEITGGTDRLRAQGYDVNGVLVDAYLTITASTDFADIATWLENAFYSAPGTDGVVTMGASNGRLRFSGAAAESVVVTSFVFEDVDNSGSAVNLSVAAFSLAGAGLDIGDVMMQHASVALTANGVRVVDSVAGGAWTVGTAGTSGTIDVRFDGDVAVAAITTP
jgi:hypothetical protein